MADRRNPRTRSRWVQSLLALVVAKAEGVTLEDAAQLRVPQPVARRILNHFARRGLVAVRRARWVARDVLRRPLDTRWLELPD